MAQAADGKGEEFKFPDEKNDQPGGDDLQINIEGEGDVKIEVVDDTPPEDRGHTPVEEGQAPDVTEEELSAYSEKVQKRIKQLTGGWHSERRAKEAALRERQELERIASTALDEVKKLKQYVHTGEQAFAGTAKAAAEAKLEMAKKKYKEAHENFDADALIAAQQELTSAQMELEAAKNFRPTPLQDASTGVESQTSVQPTLDPRVVNWQKRNPWFGSDDEMTALALATHKRLVESGVDPRSDEYFKKIDARIREKFPENFGSERDDGATHQPNRRPATVVAPTVRSSSAKKVTLTQTQVNLAKKLGISLEDYARNVIALENRK